MHTVHQTDKAPAPVGPYSQAVEVNGLVFCSGQIALDADSGELLNSSIQEETQKVMSNVEAVLQAADCSWCNVIKSTIFLRNMGDFSAVNEVYASYFSSNPPARSCIEVSNLPKQANVEVEVIAKK